MEKKIWFTGGYTDELAKAKVTNSLLDRWIGWKVVMFNINHNTAVKMESYLDNNNTNHWIRVTNLTDNGGWTSRPIHGQTGRSHQATLIACYLSDMVQG